MNTMMPFEQAVEQHGATVLRVCRAVLGAGPDAEDAWQDTFVSALKAWPDLDPGTKVEAWLVRVAHRKAVDITRARRRRPIPADRLPQTPVAPNQAPGDQGIWQTVAQLPERQRLAVAYHYFGGLPHAETAEIIGGSAEAVRRASADGVRALRRTFTAAPEPEGVSE